ncbi:UDP-N-acetylmuramate:L-alanyl-gamma-D-glutamyl-meso-diaminopimelate ligase [Moritella viscosa]|uniref:UDP-N-acetylmuramate--L-alanyl-gamma-D-glutamyl-meso-2,6-diaminoheptandioate ligase n=1 Tax=Moritella viscosa TaxID=80854 RepID=A0A090IK52_9GAMM|nr:UDP-N-acetylmuramate:L-alanyl-gamma-D-glutamyl-meso-diaminopimelate ligase [Moritella viscosa]CED61687.1 UDP-N-acetylmuramate-alanine ligase [Moritella viscosa]SGY98888.1 UDP-N-acetylmuramate-alanine ligase [Moritella viscosa]SHO05554.1 UDP-N-acetylmuramate-alanine ligase [Moritella viscosa]SHO08815.1 UDP-N-acetylmuramate-alanine ligase [Moritella viscosa]SHO12738.1 UDP-N-acetylmuramate-alanine ligase [Moritella viscosa]
MSKHIHILGICGTFMGGIAVLAKQLGYKVTGSDANVYPPMSTQLEEQGIELIEGYDPSQLDPAPDMVIVGNAMSRGNPCIEYMLNRKLAYTSGPQWLSEHLLQHRYVIAASGTHGKTTTAAMVAWILEYAGLEPGFLIGGVPQNFTESARLGGGYFFVIEADEYDTAFFDKRSKFVHYQPNTLIMNNLEYDHADIFPNLSAIQRQFHHVVRTVPSNGLILMPDNVPALDEVIQQGCWTPLQCLGTEHNSHWQAKKLRDDASQFEVYCKGKLAGVVKWGLIGDHNLQNGMMAIAAAHYAGVELNQAIAGLGAFKTPKRRMEVKGEVQGIRVYDDFAHHPTAIATTLAGLRAAVGSERIIAVLEPRSNTMRMGTHQQALAQSLMQADDVLLYQPAGLDWNLQPVADELCVTNRSDSTNESGIDNSHKAAIHQHINDLISDITMRAKAQSGPCHVLIMSNGGFAGIHDKLLAEL